MKPEVDAFAILLASISSDSRRDRIPLAAAEVRESIRREYLHLVDRRKEMAKTLQNRAEEGAIRAKKSSEGAFLSPARRLICWKGGSEGLAVGMHMLLRDGCWRF